MDSKTELIAHFIGIFDKVVEAARMRADYEEFAAVRAEMEDPGTLLNIRINVTSPYVEDGVDPTLPAFWSPAPASRLLPETRFERPGFAQDVVGGPGAVIEGTQLYSSFPAAGPIITLEFLIEPPSSVVTVNLQSAFLWDEDYFFNADLGVEYVELAVFHTALQTLAEDADGLQILKFPPPPADGAAIALISEMIAAQVYEAEAPEGDGAATIYFAKGADAAGITENGVEVEAIAAFKDLLPEALQDEEEEPAEDEEEDEAPEEVTLVVETQGGEVTVTGEAPDPEHELNTGSNTLANETYVSTNWLDAPVIAVMGNFLSIDAISQVNVYNDQDMFSGGCNGGGGPSTTALNSAQFSVEHNPILPEEEEAGEEGGEEEPAGPGPSYVAVTTIEGDVVNVNYTQQFSFAYDNDVASVQFTAHETMITMGGNTVVNAVSILELGFQYDLIVVGGSMYDVSMVMQTNILLDFDFLHLEEEFEGTVSTSDNLLMNQAVLASSGVDSIEEATEDHEAAASMLEAGSKDVPGALKSEEVFEDIEVLKVLYISGNLIDLQVVDQTNVLGDADQVALAMDTLQSETGANAQVTTGSNALFNNARLADNGIDSTVYLGGEGYSDALLYQAELIDYGNPLDDMGGAITDLASEAVVFLAEGMTGEAESGSDDAVPMPEYGEAPLDVMQSMLA
jgi:hypothetical protein